MDAPRFEPCGDKPFAAIFDADETLIWNLGATRYMAERGIAFDPVIWDSWEKTGAGAARAMPGTVEMVAALRAAGVTVIANTNRSAANATGAEETLRSEEHTSELQSLMRISYAVFCLKKKTAT